MVDQPTSELLPSPCSTGCRCEVVRRGGVLAARCRLSGWSVRGFEAARRIAATRSGAQHRSQLATRGEGHVELRGAPQAGCHGDHPFCSEPRTRPVSAWSFRTGSSSVDRSTELPVAVMVSRSEAVVNRSLDPEESQTWQSAAQAPCPSPIRNISQFERPVELFARAALAPGTDPLEIAELDLTCRWGRA